MALTMLEIDDLVADLLPIDYFDLHFSRNECCDSLVKICVNCSRGVLFLMSF